MGYLITHTIQLHKIHIHESKHYVSIGYQLPYVKLTSLPIQLTISSCIHSSNGYNLRIQDKSSIQQLSLIDSYLSECIPNYKPILSKDESYYYLYFKQNPFIDRYVHQFIQNPQKMAKVIINIIKLKKNASSTYPIVYIL